MQATLGPANPPSRRVTFALLAAVAIAGALTMWLATPWGVGMSPDSITYVAAARNLLSGRGLGLLSADGQLMPMLRYPPLYPTLLAAPGVLGADPLDAARWIHALLFAANIAVVGLAVYRFTRGSARPAVAAALLMWASRDMLSLHALAWTEPLFILCGFVGLLCLDGYLSGGTQRWLLLVASAVAVALACLTRYVGVAFVAAGLAALWVPGRRTARQRGVDAAIFAVIGCAPVGLWMVGSRWAAFAGGSDYLPGFLTHQGGVYRPVAAPVPSAIATLAGWLLPGAGAGWARTAGLLAAAAVIAALAALAAMTLVRARRSRPHPVAGRRGPWPALMGTPWIFALFVACYLGVLFVWVFVLRKATFDSRHLSAVYAAALILAACLAHRALPGLRSQPALRWMAVLLGLAYLAAALYGSAAWVLVARDRGLGFAAPAWRQSELMRVVSALPPDASICTNAPDVVYLLTGRLAWGLPAKWDARRQVRGDYADRLAPIAGHLRDGSVLVYFSSIAGRERLPSEDEIVAELSLRLVRKTAEGSIYAAS